MKFPRLLVLGYFNLLSLGQDSETAQNFMASMIAMGLTQVIHGLTQDSGHTVDVVFLLKQWQCDRREELLLAPLSWSDHAVVP